MTGYYIVLCPYGRFINIKIKTYPQKLIFKYTLETTLKKDIIESERV